MPGKRREGYHHQKKIKPNSDSRDDNLGDSRRTLPQSTERAHEVLSDRVMETYLDRQVYGGRRHAPDYSSE